ncbi:MAG: hypothetical protein K8R69_00605, partial [Deltaproteobacteria bacterium]|nr:hypothetical protein [Deltaproteobacteria bacterium]
AKSEKFALSDGAAKWEMADTLMAELLHDGCKGQYFMWVKRQKIEVRDEAFDDYRQIYGSKFEVQREDFSRLMDASGVPR